MRLGYGKGQYASTKGYRVIKNVVGVDIKTEKDYEICIREHGFRITKAGAELLDIDWENISDSVEEWKERRRCGKFIFT